MLAGAFAVELHARARARDDRFAQRDAIALERARIARELHDVIAHGVSLMGIQAAAAEQILAVDPDGVREPLQAIQQIAGDAIDELRHLLVALRAADDTPALHGLSGLAGLLDRMRAAGLPVELRIDGRPTALSPRVELSVYRIVQEALTNTLKHAGPVETTVVVRHRPDAIVLDVIDRGSGTAGVIGTGQGLIGMRERVALCGGTLVTRRPPGGGYAIRATIPTDR
jgi:signal transduction histidine kinase